MVINFPEKPAYKDILYYSTTDSITATYKTKIAHNIYLLLEVEEKSKKIVSKEYRIVMMNPNMIINILEHKEESEGEVDGYYEICNLFFKARDAYAKEFIAKLIDIEGTERQIEEKLFKTPMEQFRNRTTKLF